MTKTTTIKLTVNSASTNSERISSAYSVGGKNIIPTGGNNTIVGRGRFPIINGSFFNTVFIFQYCVVLFCSTCCVDPKSKT